MANPNVGNTTSPQSVFETRTTAQHAIGTRGEIGDRVFRYCKFVDSTAIGPNKLVQMAPPVAAHVSESATELPIGVRVVDFTPGAADVGQNEYQDGYLKVEGGTLGIGQLYQIASHPFKTQSVATTFKLSDSVVTKTTGSEVVSLIHNPYTYIVIHPITFTAPALGVSLASWAACSTDTGTGIVGPEGYLTTSLSSTTYTYTQPKYGWIQTWGVCSVLLDATDIVAASDLIPSDTVAGAVGMRSIYGDAAGTNPQKIGVAMETMATDSVYGTVFLKIAP